MQLNIYVPKERGDILERLQEASDKTGRPKNEIVLEALQAYLGSEPSRLRAFPLGVRGPWTRGALYEGRLGRARHRRR